MGEFLRVTDAVGLKPGSGMVVEVSGKTLAIFNIDGTFHAIDNTCIHRGGPLGEGDVEGAIVTCPWHGWQYDVTTGTCVANPAAKVARYEVKIEGADVKVLV
ncbi:MAG: Rieske 2Fe-2S domain-containing protein [Nitrospiraceae bacterium]|nr:Rieske 2Fe-2S domain-containing protein [Nitrospiraceae bacterium]